MISSLANRLNGITAAAIEKYLLLTGWERQPSQRNNRMWIFSKVDDPDFRLGVPATEKNGDFYTRLHELIKLLSDYQQKSQDEIITALKSSYTDRIQIRIIAESAKDGKLSLGYAAQCIEGLKDLVLYAACAEEKAQPVCARTCNNAKHSLDKFQFAQTEYGSFIFNVDVQVADETNEQLSIMDLPVVSPPPAEHRIVERIKTAFDQVDSVVSKSIKLSDLIENGYQDGITANMCDAIIKLRPTDYEDISVETTFHYANALTHAITPPEKRTFDDIHFSFVEEISKRYRDRSLVEDVALRGTIKMLSKSNPSGGEETENTVKLLARVDGQMRPISLHLSATDHTAACNAYRDDKEVEVIGTLDKSQRHWFFDSIERFTVFE